MYGHVCKTKKTTVVNFSNLNHFLGVGKNIFKKYSIVTELVMLSILFASSDI